MRCFTLAATCLAAFLWVSCAEAPQNNESTTVSPDFDLAGAHASQQDRPIIQSMPAPQTSVVADPSWHSERFKGLDPREISQAEIDELIALEKRLREETEVFQTELQAWYAKDPATRGPQPVLTMEAQYERLQALNGKVQLASIRKTYGDIDPAILSEAESEEYIALMLAQTRDALEYQKQFAAWAKMDPATRGPRPENQSMQMGWNNPRLKELEDKVQGARQAKRETDRIKRLSAAHNIPLLDNEMSELIGLHAENHKLQGEMNTAILQAIKGPNGQIHAEAISGGQLSADVFERLPKPLLYRMSEVNGRLDAIQAPFLAAEKAQKIRLDMAKLSETSGVPISSVEIEEAVFLNAEKDRIIKNTQREAGRKWKAEGGPLNIGTAPVPNAEDAARLEQIEARLKAISAPMAQQK